MRGKTVVRTAPDEPIRVGGSRTVEAHGPEGGLGDAVLEALAESAERALVHKLAVNIMPTSGTPNKLMHAGGVDAEGIANGRPRPAGARGRRGRRALSRMAASYRVARHPQLASGMIGYK